MKSQRIVDNLSGWDRMQDFPFINEQASGAWLGLAFVLLWSSRQHLKQVWRTAWGRGEPADPNEPLQYRTALLGLAGGGMLLVFALKFLRGQYTWWMFHPAGSALGVSYAMEYFWFAFFVSWLIKLLIVRFGGMRLHRAAIPLFLGLILGDYTIGSLLAIVGPLTNTVDYKIFI